MTSAERSELAAMHTEIMGEIHALRREVDAVRTRLDRWDGAITFIKAAMGVLGIGGIGLIVAALVEVGGR